MTEKEHKIIKSLSIDKPTLEDWYLNSIDNTLPPIWTEKHINELFNDFYLIRK